MLHVRHFLIALMFAALLPVAAAPPNVLLILSDDLNCDIGAYGDSQMKTPQLDRFAQTALRFDRAYCNFPVCNPSRASMLTGKLPDATGVLSNGGRFRKKLPNAVTLPQMFRNNGYFVARVGKVFHHGVSRDESENGGLDDPASWEQVVNPSGRDRAEEDKIFSLVPGNYGGALSWLAADGTDEEHTDGIGATETIKLLEEQAESGKPFFIAAGFFRPHTPYVAPKKYFDLYPLAEVKLADKQTDFSKVPEAALMSAIEEEQAMDDKTQREAIQAYHASVSFMDAQVGRVLDALDRLGLAENTIVVFASDHGYHQGEHGLWKKKNLFDRAVRIPLFIRVPGTSHAGNATGAIVELVDLYPTLADLCGFNASDKLDGKSFVPVLEDPAQAFHPGAFTEMMRDVPRNGGRVKFNGYSIRTNRYRYTEWDDGKEGVELYDYETDPREFDNLAQDPDHQGTVAELKALLHARLDGSAGSK